MPDRAPEAEIDAGADNGRTGPGTPRTNTHEPALRLDHVSIIYESNAGKAGGATVAVPDASLALAQRELVDRKSVV